VFGAANHHPGTRHLSATEILGLIGIVAEQVTGAGGTAGGSTLLIEVIFFIETLKTAQYVYSRNQFES
jgi:hypothetical protein